MNPRQARRDRAGARRRESAGVVISRHAALRLVEHGFSEEDVLITVAHPEQTYPCATLHGADRRMFQRGRVGVVVDEDARVIITVVPRRQDRWEHAA